VNPFVSSFVEDKGIGPVMDDPNAPFSNAWGGPPRNIPGVTDPGFLKDWESDAVPMPGVGDPNWGAQNDPGFEVAGESWRTPYIKEWQKHWNKDDPYKVTDPERLKNLQDIVIFQKYPGV